MFFMLSVPAGSVVRLWCGSESAVCLVSGNQTLFETHLDNSTQTTGISPHTDTHTVYISVLMHLVFTAYEGCLLVSKHPC